MSSKYARRMGQLSARIFGESARSTDVRSMKVVKIFSGIPKYKDPYIVNYYPRHRETRNMMEGLRFHGLFRDEHADFVEEMTERRKERGKEKKVPWYIQKRLAKEAEEAKDKEDFTT